MTTLSHKKIRIAADVAQLDAPSDLITQQRPSFYSGNDLQVQFALFSDGELLEISNIASVTFELKAMEDITTPPSASDEVLMTRTLGAADLNASLTPSTWNDGSAAHGQFGFSATQSNVPAGLCWMSMWVLTNDDPAKIVTVAAGPIMVAEDGCSGAAQTPPDLSVSYYNANQADARYMQKANNLSDLGSAPSARTNLGLGTAAIRNSGAAPGNVPVLNASAQIDESLLPSSSSSANASGIFLNNGWIEAPAFSVGRGEFDFIMKIAPAAVNVEQYLIGSQLMGLILHIDDHGYLRVGVSGVADVLSSAQPIAQEQSIWVRLWRKDGTTSLQVGDQTLRTLADNLDYNGNIDTLFAADASGTDSFGGAVRALYIFNRGLSEQQANTLMQEGVIAMEDRWGNYTNIYDTTSLESGRYVYLKISGSDQITLNGQTYADGSASSIDATGGVVVQLASSAITNNLSAASTLHYAGALCVPDMATGGGYQLHDQSANAMHLSLSESGAKHIVGKRNWQLVVSVDASGYIGGSHRAILPEGAIIEQAVSRGGNGAIISIGTDSSSKTDIVATHTTTAGAAKMTLEGIEASSLYVDYLSGSGSITLNLKGTV